MLIVSCFKSQTQSNKHPTPAADAENRSSIQAKQGHLEAGRQPSVAAQGREDQLRDARQSRLDVWLSLQMHTSSNAAGRWLLSYGTCSQLLKCSNMHVFHTLDSKSCLPPTQLHSCTMFGWPELCCGLKYP